MTNFMCKIAFTFLVLVQISALAVANNLNPEIRASLRIITLNTHLLSPIFQHSINNPDQAERLAKDISTQLLNDGNDYDIIALQEVWDEGGRSVFISKLSNKYPHYISKVYIDVGPMGKGEDSGLMLFSKFPFADLPHNNYISSHHTGWIFKHEGTTDQVAYIRFSAHAGEDGMASKGAMAVRIAGLQKRFFNVVVTHLQADNGGCSPCTSVREKQLKEIQKLIDGTFDANVFSNPQKEEFFLVGDANINGNICASEETTKEWRSYTGKLKTPLYKLYDTWAWTTSPQDCGDTSGTSRYDYIMSSLDGWPHSNLQEEISCVQHITRPIFHTDHRAVFADVNRPIPHCNPRTATIINNVPLYPTGGGALNIKGELWYKGTMQWFRIDQAGTYTFALPKSLFASSGPLSFQMYAKEDLTYPIAPYNGEVFEMPDNCCDNPKILEKYYVPEPPFYIKIAPKDRENNFVGPYAFDIHRHSCLNQSDACILGPNEEPYDPGLPSGSVGSGGPLWFYGDIDQPIYNTDQNLSFYVINDTGSGARLELLDDQANQIQKKTPQGGFSTAPKLTLTHKTSGPKRFFIRIQRLNNQQTKFKAGWTTNLHYLVGQGARPAANQLRMYVGDETGSDWSGSDEGKFIFLPEGGNTCNIADTQGGYKNINYSGADSDDWYWLDQFFKTPLYGNLPAVGFTKDVCVKVFEMEDSPHIYHQFGHNFIKPLPDNEHTRLNQNLHIQVDDGDYHFKYSITKRRINR